MNSLITGKVVAITGASSGIGKAIAYHLAPLGASVVLGARSAEKLQQIVAEITTAGGKAIATTTDVRNRSDLQGLVETAIAQFGRLDVLVNNAGVAQISRIDALEVEDWENMIDTNLKGVLYGMAAAIPVFRRQQGGHIVNIISTSGIKIVPMQGVYAATKNAVRTLTEAFRQESDGTIRITGISPGFVKTDFTHQIKNLQVREAMASMVQMAISPDAIAAAVAYAISQPVEVEVGDIVIRPARQN